MYTYNISVSEKSRFLESKKFIKIAGLLDFETLMFFLSCYFSYDSKTNHNYIFPKHCFFELSDYPYLPHITKYLHENEDTIGALHPLVRGNYSHALTPLIKNFGTVHIISIGNIIIFIFYGQTIKDCNPEAPEKNARKRIFTTLK